MISSQVPSIYAKSFIDELNLSYSEKSKEIKEELAENITSQGTFSLTLDAWTGIN
jgi:FPC/CPF motif-containing protein YcgG